MIYALLIYAHILLLVFWLGTDVGVFVAALWIRNPSRSMSERLLLLKLAGVIDLVPRVCSALMFPLGATIAYLAWGLPISEWALGGLWVIAAAWCALIGTAYRHEGKPLAAKLGAVQRGFLAIAGIAALAWGAWLLAKHSIPGWLAIKICLFGIIYWIAIGIDKAFGPAIHTLVDIATHGSSPAREQSLTSAINLCCSVVSMLYLVLLVAAFLGTTKMVS